MYSFCKIIGPLPDVGVPEGLELEWEAIDENHAIVDHE